MESKWSIYKEQIQELISEHDSNVVIAQILLNTTENTRENSQVDSLRTYVGRFRNAGIKEASKESRVDNKNTKHLWLKEKGHSIFATNPDYVAPEIQDIEKTFDKILEDIKTLVKESVTPIKFTPKKNKDLKADFDLGVITDVHIAMQPNPDGYSLYGGKWDEEELEDRKNILINSIISDQKSNKLILFDLGDYMDGWDGETVRKGHQLPQNMDNQKAFDVGLRFKISIIDSLYDKYESIEVINICDDNHSGAFGYVVNSAFKQIVELKYKNVKVTNQRKFLDYYVFGDKCFIATHGKDGKNLKFGFKPILDAAQIEKIDNYISEHELHKYKIYFLKGDSHQDIFDNSTAQNFKYWNFPAFSPSSNWVQTNFKKGISGFYLFNFYSEIYKPHPYYFKWKK